MSLPVDRNVRLFYVITAVVNFAPHVAVWVVYLTELRGLTLAQVGLMETFFWGVAIALEVPSGAFSDRYGRRLTLLVAIAIESVGVLLFALADGYAMLLLSYALWSAGLAFHSGNDSAFLYEMLAVDGREGEFADRYGRVNALVTSGMLAGALIGPLVAAAWGLAAPILLGAAGVAAALPMALLLDEPPRARSTEGGPAYLQTLRAGVRHLIDDRPAGRSVLVSICFVGAMVSEMLLLQPFLVSHDVPIAWFAVVAVPIQLLAIAGSLSAPALLRRLGHRVALGALLLAAALAQLAMGAVLTRAAVAGFAVLAFIASAHQPILTDYLNARLPSEIRATVLSVPQLGRSAALAALMPAVGVVATASLAASLVVMGALALAAGGGAYLAWTRAEAHERA
ncbi:MAG: MFS transporter, partial [Chloroflexi bacterium]|nr:MFS transporter [Chloroflexota bacterium]